MSTKITKSGTKNYLLTLLLVFILKTYALYISTFQERSQSLSKSFLNQDFLKQFFFFKCFPIFCILFQKLIGHKIVK